MSHFTVLVIGANVERQLQPFHEFECTGVNDEFVQDLDTSEEERADFQAATLKHVRFADGTIGTRYDDRCYREPTSEELEKHRPIGIGGGGGISWTSRDWGDGRGYRPKIHQIPAGAEEFEEPYPSFAAYLRHYHHENFIVPHGQEPDLEERHKYGYALVDAAGEVVKVIDRTNPNKKWDWWKVGGRWAGFFKLKPGADGVRGENGLLGSSRNDGPGHADSVRKGDIDIDGMRAAAAEKAGADWDNVMAVVGNLDDYISWSAMREKHQGNIDAARTEYHEQRAVKAAKEAAEADRNSMFASFYFSLDGFAVSREDYTSKAANRAISTFAVLKDGQWHERGSMGWWGAVSDEKDDETWVREFSALIDGLPDDTLLTVVDCHI